MKRIKLVLTMLLAAVLLPTSVLAQIGIYTSTFNDMTGPYDHEGSSSVNGQLLTTESNDWHYTCNTPLSFLISKTSVSGSFALSLKNIDASTFNTELASYFEMRGYVTKVTVRAGGNLSQIKARISGGSSLKDCEIGTVDATSDDVKDYVLSVDASAGENSFVECNAWGTKFRYLYVTLTPKSNNGAVIIESIKVEVSKDMPGVSTSGTIGDLTWKVEELGSTVTVYDGDNDVNKPAYRLTISGKGDLPDFNLTGYDETRYQSIYDQPWYSFVTITDIVIENGVKSIGKNGFASSTCLQRVSLPTSLETIGENAFSNCYRLTTINFPEGLKGISGCAFAWLDNLREVSLPSTLTDLCDDGFRDSFRGNNISKLTVASGNPKYDSRDNCNGIILTAENELHTGTPVTVIPKSVNKIGNFAFTNNLNMKAYLIPDHVTSIGRFAFASCHNMAEIIVGRGVKSIAKGGIGNGCNKLTDVFFYANPANLTWEFYDSDENFMADKATKFHVPSNYLATWQEKFPNINATFVGDLDGGDEPSGDGNVNGDGKTDADDVVALMNYLAGSKPAGFNEAAADVNGDSKVDIADIIALINLLLGK